VGEAVERGIGGTITTKTTTATAAATTSATTTTATTIGLHALYATVRLGARDPPQEAASPRIQGKFSKIMRPHALTHSSCGFRAFS
jgi:hypothetical protein